MLALDGTLVARIVEGIALLFVGAWINRSFERRPRLFSYYGHVSAFKSAVS